MATKMIKVTAGTTTRHFEEVVSGDMLIKDFVNTHSLSTQGSTLQLDGSPISDTNRTFSSVVQGDECFLFAVVNAKNA